MSSSHNNDSMQYSDSEGGLVGSLVASGAVITSDDDAGHDGATQMDSDNGDNNASDFGNHANDNEGEDHSDGAGGEHEDEDDSDHESNANAGGDSRSSSSSSSSSSHSSSTHSNNVQAMSIDSNSSLPHSFHAGSAATTAASNSAATLRQTRTLSSSGGASPHSTVHNQHVPSLVRSYERGGFGMPAQYAYDARHTQQQQQQQQRRAASTAAKQAGSGRAGTNVAASSDPNAAIEPWALAERTPYVSLVFSEPNDVVKLRSINLTSTATFEVWLFTEKESSLGYILFKKSTFAIALQDGELVVAFGNQYPGWKWIHASTTDVFDGKCPLREWVHVTVTYNADEEETCIYMNGQLKKSARVQGALQPSDNAVQIAVKSFRKMGQKKTRFVGRLADVRIWNVARSAADIAATWGHALDGDEPGLVGYWPLDEGTGRTISDHTVNQNHGEIVDAKWHMDVTVPPPTLGSDLKRILGSRMGSDITLVAGDDGGRVPAHRIILIARSEVFRAMLNSGMRETTMDTITLADLDTKMLRYLVEFIYTDELEIPDELAIALFVVADRYRLERLQRMCEQHILGSLCVDNVCSILETSDRLNAVQLRGITFRWIINNFGLVLRSPGFIDLDKELQYEVNLAAANMHFSSRTQPHQHEGSPSESN